ncbi:MAG: OsmC family protein [Acidimicrobiales bacterium]
MEAEELRDIQAPLKDRYRNDPAAAVITLRADGSLSETEVACSVQTGRALVEAGLHPATGGDGTLACSGDMLLQALVACAGVTLRSVATSRGVAVSGSVRAEGDLDFRGTLSLDRAAPVGFRAIRLRFDIESDATPEELDKLIATTERCCVVLQTLRTSPDLSVART